VRLLSGPATLRDRLYGFPMKSYRSRKACSMCNPVGSRERAFKCRWLLSCCFVSAVRVFSLCFGSCITSCWRAHNGRDIDIVSGRLQDRSASDLIRRSDGGLLPEARGESYLSCSRFCSIFGCLAVPNTAMETMAPLAPWWKKGLRGLSSTDFQPVTACEMSCWRATFPVT
jgi:hypothetical protein